MPTLATKDAVTLYYLQTTDLDGNVKEYYVPAGADLSEYLTAIEGAKWVYDGGIAGYGDGSDYAGTVMDVEVLVVRQEVVEEPIESPEPTPTPEPSESTVPTPTPEPSESTVPSSGFEVSIRL